MVVERGAPKSVLKNIEGALTLLIPIVGIVAVLDIPFYLTGVSILLQQYLGLFWGLVSALIFLIVPAQKKATRETPPWYDVLGAAFSVCLGLYVTIYYPDILQTLGRIETIRVVYGAIAVIIVLECTRRMEGWPLTIIVVCFIFYALFSDYFPGMFRSKGISWQRLAIQLYLEADSLLGAPLKMTATVVFGFVLFGAFLSHTGGSEFFVGITNSLLGRRRGGAAKAAVVASMLLGGFSASAVGNVATIGVITIPMMKRAGYSAKFAAAVESVSGTGDLIVPPIMGTAAFIMPEFLGVPYATVAIAALVPGILYYLGDFMQIDLRAANIGLKPLPPEEIPSLKQVFRKGWYFLVPISLLIYTIFILFLRPDFCAMISIAGLLIVVVFNKEKRQVFKISNLLRIVQGISKFLLEITAVCAAAGFIVGIVTYTGLGQSLAFFLTQLSGGNLLILAILTAIASTILGMGMPVTPCYILLATTAAPAMVSLGVSPLLAHLFVYYFGTFSFLTPPVCLAVYAAASIAEAPVMSTGFQAMKLAIAGYLVPFFFLYKPGLALMGSPLHVALAVLEGTVATVLIAMAVEAYFIRPMNWVERIAILVAGLCLFAPGWTTSMIAILIALPVLYIHWVRNR
jgi:TRAP transporter 4TM/12TM fusion protein